jgi:DNA-binding NarL/FixJ family response regulator
MLESPEANAAAEGTAGRIRVLLVDDSAMFLRIVTRFLEQHDGITVTGACASADEALARVGELDADVVLMDLTLPGLSGLEAIAALRTTRPTLPVVALTMHDTDGYRQAALAAGAGAFVPKGTLGRELVPAIHRVLRGQAGAPAPTP